MKLVHRGFPCCGNGARLPRRDVRRPLKRRCPQCGREYSIELRPASDRYKELAGDEGLHPTWILVAGPGGRVEAAT